MSRAGASLVYGRPAINVSRAVAGLVYGRPGCGSQVDEKSLFVEWHLWANKSQLGNNQVSRTTKERSAQSYYDAAPSLR